MKKILLHYIIFISVISSQIEAETIYDMFVSGERLEAISILNKLSVEENNPDAQYVLGMLYTDASSINLCNVEDFCITKELSNYKKAKKIYENLFKEHKDPRAAYALGEFYDNHWFFGRNYKKAFKYYLYAAEMGVPEAQFNVANMYEFGDGVKRNLVQSVRWYLQCNKSSLCGAGQEGIDDLISQLDTNELKLAKSMIDPDLAEIDIRITVARQIVFD